MKTNVARPVSTGSTAYAILFSISFVHLLNDTIQSVIPAAYPVLKESMQLSFTQIGLITFAFNVTASLLQPVVGLYTDRKPKPYSLPIGMGFTLAGIIILSMTSGFYEVVGAVSLIGIGSAVLHPEASRVAYLASGGGRRGLAQSIFQLGGSIGSAIGPLLAALLLASSGLRGILWLALVALGAIAIQIYVSNWYSQHHLPRGSRKATGINDREDALPAQKVRLALTVLVLLLFSKYIYSAGITSYLTFYLIEKFSVSIEQSQFYLFLFLVSGVAGTFLGGPLGDRFGRKYIIWFSILGTAPFAMLLPYADLYWSGVLCVCIGFILSSAFSVIVVYAQELMPGKVGMVSGLFFGLAFGMGGVGSAVLGYWADQASIAYVFRVCSFLPLMGVIAALLPDLGKLHKG